MLKLKVKNQRACIGCKLCVLASSRIAKNTISLNDGFISVYQGKEGFIIEIDQAQKTAYEEIIRLCPRNCFKLEE